MLRTGAIALLAIGVVAGAPSAFAGSNTANAKSCQRNGWKSLTTTNGGSFASQGACVAYAARGGTLVTVPSATITVSFSFTPGASAAGCLAVGGSTCSVDVSVAGSGLLPNSPATVGGVFGNAPTDLTVDASGNLTGSGWVVDCMDAGTVTVSATAASGAPATKSVPVPSCSQI